VKEREKDETNVNNVSTLTISITGLSAVAVCKTIKLWGKKLNDLFLTFLNSFFSTRKQKKI
jgi:hypothetical protein